MEMTSLDLDLTRGCNMNCNHCFADAHTPMPDELSTEEYKALLDQAAAYKLDRLSWGLGGEALTRKDLFEILEHASKLGLPSVVTTNGLMVTDAIAKRFAELDVRLSVSIDGATAETHEALRVIPGSLELAIRGIKRLKAAGCHVGANVTLTKHNVHEVSDLLRLAEELDLDHISLGNIMPFGRALAQPQLLLDDEDFQWLLEVAKSHIGYPIPISTFDGVLDLMFNLQTVLDTGNFAPKKTSAGRGKVVIRPNGEVWPCQLLPMPAGNVRDTPLAEILQSPVFDEVLDNVGQYESQDKTGCGAGCACTWIMHNIDDRRGERTMPFWRKLELTVPDEIGAKIKDAIAARRAAEAAST